MSHLLSKCGISSTFLQAQGFLLSFSWSKTNISWNHCRFELNFMTSWGMVSDKVIVVSADGILEVLNVSPRLLGCYNKRRWLRSRMTSLQVMYYFGYAETFTIPSDRSEMVAICFAFFSYKSAPAAIRAGSKMGCIELCNFHFCCASIFCQPIKKIELFGVTRATRQRHSKTSSTGDEDGRM